MERCILLFFTRSNEPKSVPGFETFFPSAKGMHKVSVSGSRCNLSREDNGSNTFCPITLLCLIPRD